jgi:hypothetical protein
MYHRKRDFDKPAGLLAVETARKQLDALLGDVEIHSPSDVLIKRATEAMSPSERIAKAQAHIAELQADLSKRRIAKTMAEQKESLPPKPTKFAWEPCPHWGGRRPCAVCQQETDELSGSSGLSSVATNMARAQALWLDLPTRTFVRNRVRAELYRYNTTDGNLLDELEMDCWEKVAARISQYRDLGLKRGAWAWLKAVVFSTVTDHFRVNIRRNQLAPMEPLIFDDKSTPDDHDRRLADRDCPAAPTRPFEAAQ